MTKKETALVEAVNATPKKEWTRIRDCAPWSGSVYRVQRDGYDFCISFRTPIAMRTPKGEFVRLWDGYTKTSIGHLNSWNVETGFPQFNGKAWRFLLPGRKYAPSALAKAMERAQETD